jgi:hypothetical protein
MGAQEYRVMAWLGFGMTLMGAVLAATIYITSANAMQNEEIAKHEVRIGNIEDAVESHAESLKELRQQRGILDKIWEKVSDDGR